MVSCERTAEEVSFARNGHTIGFHTQTQKLTPQIKQVVPCENTAEEVSFEW